MRVSGMLSEKIFLNQLLNKKAKKGISPEERDKLRIKLLYDLLNRDVNELKTFELNVEKFNTAKGLDSLLDQKLEQQKRKVEIKRELLKQLKSAQNQG
jgi:HKD family nuclease